MTKTTRSTRKLELNRETLRALSASDLRAAAGGQGTEGVMSQKNAICMTPAC